MATTATTTTSSAATAADTSTRNPYRRFLPSSRHPPFVDPFAPPRSNTTNLPPSPLDQTSPTEPSPGFEPAQREAVPRTTNCISLTSSSPPLQQQQAQQQDGRQQQAQQHQHTQQQQPRRQQHMQQQQQQPAPRRPGQPPPETVRTRSVPFCGAAVTFERAIDPTSPPTDDEIIIVTVKFHTAFRRASAQENAALPSRPPARGFLRRMSTRWTGGGDADDDGEAGAAGGGGGGGGSKRYKFTVLKMPRREYKRHFARDRHGRYVGTEPERIWSRDELDEAFARFQEMPLRSHVPGEAEDGDDRHVGGERRASVV